MLRSLLDLVYPRTCLCCTMLLPDSERVLCSHCSMMIRRFDTASSGAVDTTRSVTCGGFVEGLISLYVFEEGGPIRVLLHALKYRSFPSIGTQLGHELGLVVARRHTGATLIIPVPISRRKKRERGYNQAVSIARGVSRTTAVCVDERVLLRVRDKGSQTSLSREERRRNVLNAFAVSPSGAERVAGKTCLLVDDVITTGATVRECARVLRAAGASGVIACSIAVAEWPGIDTAAR